ncbi:hypothetical protein [Microbacterium sp. MMO-10]|uniref:hypothetical protein n=1 Tax=Microbacterium sp. MMO-10 TaxID=3081272 RepID=UPI0030163ECB
MLLLLAFLVIGLGLFGFFGFWILGSTSRRQRNAELNAEQILDDAFDGSPDVTFTINMTTVKYETVILGAKQRGYRLVHQADTQYGPRTLIFEKA